MFYVGLLLYLLVGLLAIARPKAAIILFCTLAALWPTGNAFIEINYRAGIFVSDPFWIGFTARLIYSRKRYNAKLIIILSCTTLLYAIYLLSTLLFSPNRELTHILKDFRPLLVILQTSIFLLAIQRLTFAPQTLNRIVLLGVGTFFLEFLALSMGIYETKDGFFKEEAFRYLDGSTYVAAAFLIWHLTNRQKKQKSHKSSLATFGALLEILAAGSRVVIVAQAATAITYSRGIRSKLLTLSLIILFVSTFFGLSYIFGATRVIESMQLQGLFLQLGTRFGPALQEILKQDFGQMMIGAGLGATFEVPWLDHLGYDTASVSIDSTYLTLFYKFGILSIPIVSILLYLPTSAFSRKNRFPFVLFIGIIFLVSALPYQSYGIIINTALILMAKTSTSNDQEKLKKSSRYSNNRSSINLQ